MKKQWGNDEYLVHANLVKEIGDNELSSQFKTFKVDKHNKDVLMFLLCYFNGLEQAERIFPNENYKISKNLLICGKKGSGKTLIMSIMAKYLQITKNKMAFNNLSVTQMINYYKLNNHLDRYTFNEMGSTSFDGNPFGICINDIGLNTGIHFGVDTKTIVQELLFARNDIWTQYNKHCHITTNLSTVDLVQLFDDEHHRLPDRFKTYNIINLEGESRR